MSNFALDSGSSSGDIISSLNYALANLGNQTGAASTTANVLTANIQTGNISTTYSNTAGYATTTIVSYLYQYMAVAFANSATGGSGFTTVGPTLANYYGLYNTTSNVVSTNPVDYSWYQVAGGFGTTKNLYYQTLGGRQLNLFIGTAAPDLTYVQTQPNTPINLDSISSPQNNQVIIESAYLLSNISPGTPSGGFYNFATLTLIPPDQPIQWTTNLPSVTANANVWISQAQFVGNSISNVAPATTWTSPAVIASGFSGNTGAQGQRGFVPMGYVVTLTDPTGYNDSQYSTAFSSSRSNTSPPIGLGFAPIAGDTAQFFYQNPLNPSNDVTIVKQYDGANWNTVVGTVISGNLFVTQSINASRLNANDIYAINIQSTGANIGNVASPGYWLQANTGSASFAGTVTIGNNLTVGNNAVVGNNFSIGSNLSVGDTATIGANLSVGNNASIGGNVNISGLVISGNLAPNTVTTTQITNNSITTGKIQANTITGNLIQANTIQGSSIVAGSITTTQLAANAIVVGNITSFGTTLGDPNATGYWLSNTNGAARFGGNTSIGTNLTVGDNAVIGGNLNVTGLVTGGNLQSNTVVTNTMVYGAVSQGIGVSSSNQYVYNAPKPDNGTSSGVHYSYPNAIATVSNITNTDSVYINATYNSFFTTAAATSFTIFAYLFRNDLNSANPNSNIPLSKITSVYTTSFVSGNQNVYVNPSFTFLDTVGNVSPYGNTHQYSVGWGVFNANANASSLISSLTYSAGTVIAQVLKR